MSNPETQRIRSQLVELRAQLSSIAEQSAQSVETVELDQSSVGRLSRMDAMQAQQMAIESNRRRLDQLKQIEAALFRIDRGEYGICTICDEMIDPRRLGANPLATTCIKCAE